MNEGNTPEVSTQVVRTHKPVHTTFEMLHAFSKVRRFSTCLGAFITLITGGGVSRPKTLRQFRGGWSNYEKTHESFLEKLRENT